MVYDRRIKNVRGKKRTTNRINKSVLLGIALGMIVFFSGFFMLFIFWNIWINDASFNPELKGLFDYKASAIGDSICLPALSGALLTYILFNRENIKKKNYIIPGIIASLTCLAGIVIQISWLKDPHIESNWTILNSGSVDRLNIFNGAGLWHAVFFAAMFALLGWLFTRFFQMKCFEENSEDEKQKDNLNTILQYIIWVSGSFFIFLNFTDDYSGGAGNIFWIMLFTATFLFVIVSSLLLIMSGVRKRYIATKNNRSIVNEIILLISGIMTAFALICIINGAPIATEMVQKGEGIINVGYIVAASLLLVIFVVPNTENIAGMIIAHIITATPAVLLEVNVSLYGLSAENIVICILVIAIPVLIAVLYHKKYQDKLIHKKAAVSSFALLINITAVFLRYMFPDGENFDALFEELINVVLVTVIPQYVKSVFDELVVEEAAFNRKDEEGNIRDRSKFDETEKDRLQRKRSILYVISAVIFVGVIVMMFSVIIPHIPFVGANNYKLSSYLWIGIGVIALILFILKMNAAFKKRKYIYNSARPLPIKESSIEEVIDEKEHKRMSFNELSPKKDGGKVFFFVINNHKNSDRDTSTLRKIISIILLIIAYAVLSVVILISLSEGHVIPHNFKPLHFLIIPPLLFTSLEIAHGYYCNMLEIRGHTKNNIEKRIYEGGGYVISASIVIFFGSLLCSTLSVFQMIKSDSILSIIFHMIILLISNILLPVLIAGTQDKKPLKNPQLIETAIFWDSGTVFSVLQDSFLFSITSIAVEVMTVFYVAKTFTPDFGGKGLINVVVGLFLLLQFSSWALEYCIENDITHFQRIRYNSDFEYKKSEKRKYTDDEFTVAYKRQYEALHRHICFSIISSILLAMPYSVFTIISMIFSRSMQSDIKRPLFIPDIEIKDRS